MKQKFDVTGMTCSACSAAIEKKVGKINGVKNATVNLLNNCLIADYDENLTNNTEIVEAVKSLGYGAEVSENKATQEKLEFKSVNASKEPSLKLRFILSLIFLIPLMIISMGHMLGMPLPNFFNPKTNPSNFALIQLVLTTPILIINFKYFTSGTKAVLNKSPNMDTLVMLGSISAYLYSFVVLFIINANVADGNLSNATSLAMNMFFESSAMILTLVTLGKWLEDISKGKTKSEISKLIKLKPSTVLIEQNGEQIEINIKDLKVNDIVIIKAGNFVPCDGTIIEGYGSLNKSAITGESLPVEVVKDDYVTSASIAISGFFKLRAEKVGAETMLEKIIQLMEDSGNNKAPIARLADKVSGVFVPTVVAISIITLIVWLIISKNFSYALNLAISVLVISCPCALGLATPVAIMVGIGVGSKNGILFKDSETLEKLHKVKNVVMDKTATITEGKLSVVDIKCKQIDKNEFLQIVLTLEKNSTHPIRDALVEYCQSQGVMDTKLENYTYVVGKGIRGDINKNTFILGNAKFLKENKIKVDIVKFEQTCSPVYVANLTTKQFLGALFVEDKIKPTSKSAVSKLQQKHIETFMLSGDNAITANAVAKTVGIQNVFSDVLPEDKLNIVSSLQQNGLTAFVGDGINDAPALKQSDVGIAIGNGTDVAIESANVVLINNNLLDVDTAINLSKSTVTNIKENLFWAFFYNVIGIPIAAGVLVPVGVMLNPMIAAGAMSLSSLFVVLNALRLRLFKNKNKKENNMKVLIEGMSCNHCKQHVEEALNSLDGVSATVDLKKKCAMVENTKNVSNQQIINAVENAGYKVKKIVEK